MGERNVREILKKLYCTIYNTLFVCFNNFIKHHHSISLNGAPLSAFHTVPWLYDK